MIENPLFGSQREKSGAVTFSKYIYQYHWALHRAIEEHLKGREYALFVEVHEDVVIATSLIAEEANFEFNQVKTDKAKYTSSRLVKLEKGSSVLGKLISSVNNKSFASLVQSINFVALNGFSIQTKDPKLTLKKLGVQDIDSKECDILTKCLKKEIGIDNLPQHLFFVVPNLSDKNFENQIIGEISTLVYYLYNSTSTYNPISIYRSLCDDIYRKGSNLHDIRNWDEFLKEKALTSKTISSIISQFVNTGNEATLTLEFNKIMQELDMNTIQSKPIKKAFLRYNLDAIGNKSNRQLDISREIRRCVELGQTMGFTDLKNLIDYVSKQITPTIRIKFHSTEEITAAIIYEYIKN